MKIPAQFVLPLCIWKVTQFLVFFLFFFFFYAVRVRLIKQALVAVFAPCSVFKVDIRAFCASRDSETRHPYKVISHTYKLDFSSHGLKLAC